MDLSTVASCSDLTLEHARQAASSAASMRRLLDHFVAIARPGEGCPKILMAFACLAEQEWLEGDLRVELAGDPESTTLVILCEYGAGIREKLFPAARFAIPFDEFERALHLAPKLVLPLKPAPEAGMLVLARLPTGATRAREAVLPMFEVDQASLAEEQRTTAPPPLDELQVVDEATPDADLRIAPTPAHSGEHQVAPRPESGVVPGGRAGAGDPANVHTRPTVRRMVAVDALVPGGPKTRRDPRREDD